MLTRHTSKRETNRAMATNNYSMDVSARYRVAGGRYLAELRKSAGLTGPQVGSHFGVHKMVVSSWETGKTPVRPLIMEALADLYGIDRVQFSKNMLKYRDPLIYAAIFGTKGDKELREVCEEIRRDAAIRTKAVDELLEELDKGSVKGS